MENAPLSTCSKCNNTLPAKGYFCGHCLTQFKCKNCGGFLNKEDVGCTECGTPKSSSGQPQEQPVMNTFRFHENSTDRTIEASFTNTVGKDLTDALKDIYSSRNIAPGLAQQFPTNNADWSALPTPKIEDAQLEINDNTSEENANSPLEPATPKSGTSNYPNLMAVTMKKLPGPEIEWVTVYAFYASNFGENIFTRQDILTQYKASNRKSSAKVGGLSTEIKTAVRKNYFNPLQNGFSLLEDGIKAAKEIINRSTPSAHPARVSSKSGNEKDSKKEKKSSEGKKQNGAKGDKNLKRIDIEFKPQGKTSLSDFFNQYNLKNINQKNLLFVYYLKEVLQIEGVTVNHIYSCYDALDIHIPQLLAQVLKNTASKTGWINTQDGQNILFTTKGRNELKSWQKNG